MRDYVIIYDRDKQRYIFGVVVEEVNEPGYYFLQARFYNGKKIISNKYSVRLDKENLGSRPPLDKGFRTIDRVIDYVDKHLVNAEILKDTRAYKRCIQLLKESRKENE